MVGVMDMRALIYMVSLCAALWYDAQQGVGVENKTCCYRPGSVEVYGCFSCVCLRQVMSNC